MASQHIPYTYLPVHVRRHVCTYVHVCMHVHVCVCMHVHVCVCMHALCMTVLCWCLLLEYSECV